MKLNKIFAQKGLLGKHFKNYEEREQQLEMAEAVRSAIRDERPAVIEGSAGVGKSFAYLIPLILSEKKAIISTSNKSLQDQLSKKDLPALKKVLPVDFNWTVLKGKSNYFCQANFETYLSDIEELTTKSELKRIVSWANRTDDGDVEHFPGNLPTYVKKLITCDKNTVHSRDSVFYGSCFAVKARIRARSAQIVLTNHTLVALDSALRKKTKGKVGLLPKVDFLIIDEAHAFEKYAMMAFSDKINIFSLRHFLKQSVVRKTIPKGDLEHILKRFSAVLRGFKPPKGTIYYKQKRYACLRGFESVISELSGVVEKINNNLKLQKDELGEKRVKDAVNEGKNLIERLNNLSLEDDNMLRWSEARELHGRPIISLVSVPIDVSEILKKDLFNKKTVICTSATLVVNGRFDFFKSQLGVPDDAMELAVSSPFDFKKNCLIYISDGASEKYYEIEKLIEMSKGNAFVLFTSYKDMNKMYERVSTPYPKFIQNNNVSRANLIKEFKDTPNAVLFGTKSFWEGVDIQDNKLILVIIHKMPFENPSDLIYSTRIEMIDKKLGKGEHWIRYTVPSACLKLKQGAGRLLRSKTDFGTIALLDSRVNFRNYGNMAIDALPPAYRTQKLKKVKAFYEKMGV